MNLQYLLELLGLLQLITLSQNSHVQQAKQRIQAEVQHAMGQHGLHSTHYQPPHQHRRRGRQYHPPSHFHKFYHGSHWHNGNHVHRLHGHHNQWSGRRHGAERHHFSSWTPWSDCNKDCIKRRERFCKAKRKCGLTKHVEERKCWHCHKHESPIATAPTLQHHNGQPSIIINAAAAAASNGPATPAPATTIIHQAPPQLHVHHPLITERPAVLQEYETHTSTPPHYSHPSHSHHSHRHYEHAYVRDHDDDSYERLPYEDTAASSVENHYADAAQHSAEDTSIESSDFFAYKRRNKFRKQKRPRPNMEHEIDYADYDAENDDEADVSSDHDDSSEQLFSGEHRQVTTRPKLRHYKRFKKQPQQRHRHHQSRRGRGRSFNPAKLERRNLITTPDDGLEGDTFQYEDFDFESGETPNSPQYGDSFLDSSDYLSSRNSSFIQERNTPDGLTPRHRRLFSKWSRWNKCSAKCTTRRYKKCRVREQCGREVLREIAYCYTEGSFCQQWLQAQVQKTPPYELRPVAASRRRDIGDNYAQSNNAISNDYIMNSKGYRGPEYTPMKLKCGIAPIRNNRRNMYNMLKIIGGKAARKGEWPWQVAIFNRFEEAFCGGTLIAPQWVLTAAHCVRKVLYVRLGEHNLGVEDGTELQLRVHSSFKHPNFDKRTVDSDVALLRLPKPIEGSTWISFSCLPRPFQPLPKNVDCTVIGWGKRRNRDAAGTNLLHQAEVPIIPMDNCRSVYRDYNITKNMFCAGHKRGRIDTCAGDSGGPLLCRDATKPNHPWTIFGITSFGDGCAKRNKFGIYAKVPNYVDWIWSVINCNGNCKLYQRMTNEVRGL